MFGLSADKTFYEYFDRSADNMVRTAEKFRELMHDWDRRQEIFAIIHEYEHQGDQITHDTITKLDQTFITPLDREDIHNLVAETDDIVDMIDAAAQRLILYKVDKPTEDIVKQAETVVAITKVLAEAIKKIRNLKKQDELGSLLIRIHALENEGDQHNHASLARLFESGDPIFVIKWKELYELVEMAIDACETVANTIRSIMVKNA